VNDMSYDCTHSGDIDFSLAGTDSIVISILFRNMLVMLRHMTSPSKLLDFPRNLDY
jgi:hypothetical protein